MSQIKHPMSGSYEFFHETVQKSSIPKCQELSIRWHFYLDFPWKCQKGLDTQMSEIKHPMSVLYGFFPENVTKSSIPKCHELSLRCHFYLDFPWKCQKKLDTQMSQIKHPMSGLYEFFHENVQKSSIPKCHKLSIRWHFYLDVSMEMSKKARYPNVRN